MNVCTGINSESESNRIASLFRFSSKKRIKAVYHLPPLHNHGPSSPRVFLSNKIAITYRNWRPSWPANCCNVSPLLAQTQRCFIHDELTTLTNATALELESNDSLTARHTVPGLNYSPLDSDDRSVKNRKSVKLTGWFYFCCLKGSTWRLQVPVKNLLVKNSLNVIYPKQWH